MKRYQVTAQALDQDKRVQGYLTMMWGSPHIVLHDNENAAYPIDPATIEPVKVPVSIGENGNIYCPRCKSKIGILRGLKYCSHCGQALDWAKEEANG